MLKIKSAALMALLLPMPLLVTGCVGSPPVLVAKAPCSDLIPDAWRKPVEHAAGPREVPAPADGSIGAQLAHAVEVGKAWMEYGLAETGQLEKANGRAADSIGITERCEARDRAAVERSKPRFLGIF